MLEVAHENLHSADAYGQPLGIECACRRRVLVPIAELARLRGNMRRISELRFVCRQCGSRDYKAFLFLNAYQAEAFAAGQSYADTWDLRHAGLAADDPRVMYWTNPNPYRTTPTEPEDMHEGVEESAQPCQDSRANIGGDARWSDS